MERKGKMERNLGDRAEHRTVTAGILLGSGKAPQEFEGKKVGSEVDMETNEDIKQGKWFGSGTE